MPPIRRSTVARMAAEYERKGNELSYPWFETASNDALLVKAVNTRADRVVYAGASVKPTSFFPTTLTYEQARRAVATKRVKLVIEESTDPDAAHGILLHNCRPNNHISSMRLDSGLYFHDVDFSDEVNYYANAAYDLAYGHVYGTDENDSPDDYATCVEYALKDAAHFNTFTYVDANGKASTSAEGAHSKIIFRTDLDPTSFRVIALCDRPTLKQELLAQNQTPSFKTKSAVIVDRFSISLPEEQSTIITITQERNSITYIEPE